MSGKYLGDISLKNHDNFLSRMLYLILIRVGYIFVFIIESRYYVQICRKEQSDIQA